MSEPLPRARVHSLPRRCLVVVALASVLAGCTSGPAAERDADRDGLSDAEELEGWDILVERADGNVSRSVKSFPSRPDSDGDGLSDLEERGLGLDPVEVDTDGDGLLDGTSIEAHGELAAAFRNWSIVEDPEKPGRFLGEADVCVGGALSPSRWDSDRPRPDGVGDGEELLGWNVTVRGESRLVRSSPCVWDSDSDGWSDGEERDAGTDPTLRDTDGDGAPDSLDVDPLKDLGLRVTVESVRLDGDVPEGARLRVTINVAGEERAAESDAVHGENRPRASVAANSDDVFNPRAGGLPIPVVVRVDLRLADGSLVPLNLSARGAVLEFSFDMRDVTVSLAGEPGRPGAAVVSGADGGARVAFSREEF